MAQDIALRSRLDRDTKSFLEHFLLGNRTLSTLGPVAHMLPAKADDLLALASCCITAADHATAAGYMPEALRLARLGQELRQRADTKRAIAP
jgi:hypothetical protein